MLLFFIALDILTFLLCVGEVYWERDWPREMFKFFAFFAVLTILWIVYLPI